MYVIIGIVLVVLVRWYYLKSKKRLTIRSILYLQRIAYDMTTEEANEAVLTATTRSIDRAEGETNVMLNEVYHCNRSLVIHHARLEGYRG